MFRFVKQVRKQNKFKHVLTNKINMFVNSKKLRQNMFLGLLKLCLGLLNKL